MSRLPLIISLFFSLVVAACASKSDPVDIRVGSPAAQEPSEIQAIKRPTQTSDRTDVQPASRASNQAFYAKLQVLSQTEARGSCGDELRYSEEVIEDFIGELSNEKLVFLGPTPRTEALFNMTIRSIGFDESRYRLSLQNGEQREEVPYALQVNSRPSNEIEIQYLGESVRFNPQTTPISSFQATESRQGCDIIHTVNVYTEDVGVYALSDVN